jgi:hypothetical protein
MAVSEMNRWVLLMDEAGFLGYTDRDESFPGEFGLAAGVLLRADRLNDVERSVANANFTVREGGKLHITDLTRDDQARARKFFIDLVSAEGARLFYSAHSVRGHYDHYCAVLQATESAAAARKSSVRVVGHDRPQIRRLLEEVYHHLVGDVVAVLGEDHGGDYQLTVRVDRTDDGILAALEGTVVELCKPSHQVTKRVAGWDPVAKKRMSGSLTIQWDYPQNLAIQCTRENLSVDLAPASPELALLPDILASWVEHELRRCVSRDACAPLNDRLSFADSPLVTHVETFRRESTFRVADTLFARKERPSLAKTSNGPALNG